MVRADEPDLVVAARRVSPLLMGVAEDAAFLASDIPAILGLTREFFVLEDDQVAELRPGSVRVTDARGRRGRAPDQLTVDWDLDAARKDGYDDFMSKEIHEQPEAVADTLLDRLLPDGTLVLDEVRITNEELRRINKVFIVACGSSYHAGLMAKYAIEHWARLPVEIDIASEFRYRDPVLDPTHPGHRGQPVRARPPTPCMAMRGGPPVRGPRCWSSPTWSTRRWPATADAVLYTRAGPEIGVAATKTHLAQITALEILALVPGPGPRAPCRRPTPGSCSTPWASLPDKVALALERSADVEAVADRYRDSPSFIFLGRQVGYPVALEGALKLKEISYLRAEGFPAGELKHGPIALVEPGTVVVGVATRTPSWEKMMSNITEVKSRGATVVLVANDGDEETARQADAVLWVPATEHLLRPGHRRGAHAVVRLLPGPAARSRRRPTPQPGQDGHRRVTARPVRRVRWPTLARGLAVGLRRRGRGRRIGVVGVGIDAVDLDRFRTGARPAAPAGQTPVHRG